MSAIVEPKPAAKQRDIRRFVIRADDYDKVLTWLRRVDVVDDMDDEKQGEVPAPKPKKRAPPPKKAVPPKKKKMKKKTPGPELGCHWPPSVSFSGTPRRCF